tara:strand:+ start:181423 stop:181524 length:102 start_codon:yes stop_codon:yes gene_type:complete
MTRQGEFGLQAFFPSIFFCGIADMDANVEAAPA